MIRKDIYHFYPTRLAYTYLSMIPIYEAISPQTYDVVSCKALVQVGVRLRHTLEEAMQEAARREGLIKEKV